MAVLLPIKNNRSDYLTAATFNSVTNDTGNLRKNNRSVSFIDFPPFFLFILMLSFWPQAAASASRKRTELLLLFWSLYCMSIS